MEHESERCEEWEIISKEWRLMQKETYIRDIFILVVSTLPMQMALFFHYNKHTYEYKTVFALIIQSLPLTLLQVDS